MKTRELIKNGQMNDGTNHQVFPYPLGTETLDISDTTTTQSLLNEKETIPKRPYHQRR